jgi:hypothetical protein
MQKVKVQVYWGFDENSEKPSKTKGELESLFGKSFVFSRLQQCCALCVFTFGRSSPLYPTFKVFQIDADCRNRMVATWFSATEVVSWQRSTG